MNEPELLALVISSADILAAGADTLYCTIVPPTRRESALTMAVISAVTFAASTLATTADTNAVLTAGVST